MSAMISVDEAIARICTCAAPLVPERVAVGDAVGRYAAETVTAKVTNLPYRASAMDGYAVRFDDVKTLGASLSVIGEVAAGAQFDGDLAPGQAVRIFTGAIVPETADHVIIQEEIARQNDQITVSHAQEQPGNIRAPGQDFQIGDPLIAEGEFVSPLRAALMASGNIDELAVTPPPLVAFFGNGNELRAPGSTDIAPGQVISSTPYGLAGLIDQFGGRPMNAGVAADSIDSINAIIDQAMAAGADVITPLGGASVGDYDLVRPAFEGRGFDFIFEKIAVKPGKPTWLAKKENTLVLGLPGNPGSAFACAHLFLAPLLRCLGGASEPQTRFIRAQLAAPLRENGGREHYLRAYYDSDENGVLHAAAFAKQDSSLLMPFSKANCLLKRAPNAPAANEGDIVEIMMI